MIAPSNGILDMLSFVAPKNPRGDKRMLNLMSYRASILNRDVCYESSCIWTLVEEIIGNQNLIKFVYDVNKNGNSLAQLIHNNGHDWKIIRTLLIQTCNSDIVDLYTIRLLEFFKNAKLIIEQNSELIESFNNDFTVLCDVTNEVEL